jgi:hypothetical protein
MDKMIFIFAKHRRHHRMNKKIWVPLAAALLIATIVAVWVSGEALAQEPTGAGNFVARWRIARRGLGQVIEISGDQFSVQDRKGAEFILFVDETTRFRYLDRSEMSYSDLEVDRWVVVVPQRIDDEQLSARLVVILPEDFDPAQYFGVRGVVASVDLAMDEFTLQTQEGDELTFAVDENTRFLGEVQALGDLEPEMGAQIRARLVEDGDPLALVVGTGESRRSARIVGQIEAVDIENHSFSLAPRRGEDARTIFVGEDTRFKGRGDELSGLDDLEAGMYALVVVRRELDGDLTAVGVAAAAPDQLPKFEARAIGRINSVKEASLVITIRDGSEHTVHVSESTVYRSRVPDVNELADLEPGMIVALPGFR